MKDKKHPEYQIEEARLKETINIIHNEIVTTNITKQSKEKNWGSTSVNSVLRRNVDSLLESYEKPYWGRIDFLEDASDKVEEIYIGIHYRELGDRVICDWRSPIGEFFTKSGTAKRQGYSAPKGYIHGSMLLKRRLVIKNKELIEIIDEVDRRPGSEQRVENIYFDKYLINHLYSRGDTRLKHIVETIQAQQDKIIRTPANKIMIINGVAGSGKTSIAYHRLAYLLYPENTPLILPQNTIIFGPNRLFLSYAQDILPGLGIHEVAQTTFEDWALEKMGLSTRKNNLLTSLYKIEEKTLSLLLSSGKSGEKDFQRAKLKGSLRMQKIIDDFVNFLRNNLNIPENGLIFPNIGGMNFDVLLPTKEILDAHRITLSRPAPIEKQRTNFVNLLINKLLTIITTQHKIYERYNPKESEQVINQLTKQLELLLQSKINSLWPKINIVEDYYNFLSNKELLQTITHTFLTEEELYLLWMEKQSKKKFLDIEDIPAIYYLHICINGRSDVIYNHIIIDEAQDLSPFQFYLLAQHNPSQSMTILGDISQNIYAHRGIYAWEEIKSIFNKDSVLYEEILQNYRSTSQIVDFTNQILKQVNKNSSIAQPFARPGEKPTIVNAPNEENMYEIIVNDIKLLKSGKIRNIALIVKTVDECLKVKTALENLGLPIKNILDRNMEFNYKEGIVILPAFLAKGLEFEATLVVNVDSTTYNQNSDYDGRLLYVATTRALHYLNLYFVGEISPFLELAIGFSIYRGATTEWERRYNRLSLEDSVLIEDLRQLQREQRELTENQVFRRSFDGKFQSNPLRDNYGEDSDAQFNEFNWWD